MSLIGKGLPTEERRKLLINISRDNREKGKALRENGGSLAKAQECDHNADYFLNIAVNLK